MTDFANWLLGLIKDLLQDAWDLLTDLFISLLDALLQALLTLINAIPLPQFLMDGLSNIFSNISPDVWYFASHFKFGQCFAVLGAAVAFRLARKLLTLFQW